MMSLSQRAQRGDEGWGEGVGRTGGDAPVQQLFRLPGRGRRRGSGPTGRRGGRERLRHLAQRAEPELGRDAFEDGRRVQLVEQRRDVGAAVGKQDLLAAGVLFRELRDVVHLAVDDHPARLRAGMLRDLRLRQQLLHGGP